MTSLKTSIKTITYLSDTGCLEIQGASLAGMAYIQLSLCGVAGEVVIGNALCNERRRVLLTPGHYLGNWSYRQRHFQKQIAG